MKVPGHALLLVPTPGYLSHRFGDVVHALGHRVQALVPQGHVRCLQPFQLKVDLLKSGLWPVAWSPQAARATVQSQHK
eukprot:4102710-Amphidinium_carterae.1